MPREAASNTRRDPDATTQWHAHKTRRSRDDNHPKAFLAFSLLALVAAGASTGAANEPAKFAVIDAHTEVLLSDFYRAGDGNDASFCLPGHAESNPVRWHVHRALDELPERDRTLIELVYWSELSQSEIATHLGIPLGSFKTRARTALARLAELLEHEPRERSGGRRAPPNKAGCDPLRHRNRAGMNCQSGDQ
jgi:RNA polymerase sigma factor (sigma-70 family)